MIKVSNVSKSFVKSPDLADKIAKIFGQALPNSTVHALDNVSLSLNKGEILGLVGESGSGKSTLGRIMAGLMSATKGEVTRETDVQFIFQDASAALNPRMKAIDLITEAPLFHNMVKHEQREEFALKIMGYVGLDKASLHRFPHQFSGGQRARLGIARALAVNPKVLILDEAVASLDVSIQAQILNLLMTLKDELSLSMLFISHDLSVIGHIADRVCVLYLGRVVEIGTRNDIFEKAKHPYTQSLLKEIPQINGLKRVFTPIIGEIPSPLNPPSGCHFHPRCTMVMGLCSKLKPELLEINTNHHKACHLG